MTGDPVSIEELCGLGQQVSEACAPHISSKLDYSLLTTHVMALVLTKMGIPSAPTVMDTYFTDSDYEGTRVFAFTINDQPYDLQGRYGWGNIVEANMASSKLFADREWEFVEGSEPQETLRDEISAFPDFDNIASQVANFVFSNNQAQQIADHTPAVSSSAARRPGL